MRITQLFPGILAICYLGALSIPRHAWQDPGKIMSLTCSFHLFLSAYKKFTQSLYSFQIYWQIAATKHFGCAQTCLTTSKKKWNNQFVAHIHVSVSTKLQQLLDSFQRYWQFGMHDMTQPKWNDQCLGSMDVSLHAKH